MSPPTFLAYLAHEIVRPIIRKGTFSSDHVVFADYMASAVFLYETGAALGYTFQDRIATFAKLFSEQGREAEVATNFGDVAAAQLRDFSELPRDVMDLFFKPEATRVIQVLQRAGLMTCSHWSDYPKVAKQKMRVADVFSPLPFSAAQGIGFGSRYPELTEQLLTFQYDPRVWRELRFYGLDLPASPEPKTMQQRQAEARAMIVPYVSAKRPELIIALELC
jgi:hypothetical protein